MFRWTLGAALTTRSERPKPAVADQGAGQLEQPEVDVGAAFILGAQSLEGVQPRAKLRSTTQCCLPRPEPWATPRRAIRGVMPRARSRRR